MSCLKPTQLGAQTPDPSSLVSQIQALSKWAPGLSGSALVCLNIDTNQLDERTLGMWREIVEKELRHYPQHAGEVISALLGNVGRKADLAADALLQRFDFLRLSQAFELCHAKLEMIAPGLGRKLAGKLAMRALRYPMVNYWLFGQEPLGVILIKEPVEGFAVQLGAGEIPWLVAWAVAALEEEVPVQSVGVAAVFDMLMGVGCRVDEDPHGAAGQAMVLGCAGIELGNPRAESVVRLLMEAGAPWQHIHAPKGSIVEQFLLQWPQVKRARLRQLCPDIDINEAIPAM